MLFRSLGLKWSRSFGGTLVKNVTKGEKLTVKEQQLALSNEMAKDNLKNMSKFTQQDKCGKESKIKISST